MAEPLPGRLFMEPELISSRVKLVADEILAISPRPEIMLPVLSGAFLFAADLLRELADRGFDLELCPIQVKREHGVPVLKAHRGVHHLIAGKRILIVDTIHDSGHTARYLVKHLSMYAGVRHISFAALLCRNMARLPHGIDSFVGVYLMPGCNEYFYGYGMDRNGAYRGLSSIYLEPPSDAVPESKLVSQDQS